MFTALNLTCNMIMKKISLLLSAAVLSLLLFSCGTPQHADFSKRKYLDRFVAKKQKLEKSTGKYHYEIKERKLIETAQDEQLQAQVDKRLLPVTELKIMPEAIVRKSVEAKIPQQLAEEPARKNLDEVFTSIIFARPVKKAVYKSPAPQETDMIVKIILAILIPPLAVYLHEGISTYFWVTLVLFLLWAGWFWGPFFGLAGLAAIVIALLVVTDNL